MDGERKKTGKLPPFPLPTRPGYLAGRGGAGKGRRTAAGAGRREARPYFGGALECRPRPQDSGAREGADGRPRGASH